MSLLPKPGQVVVKKKEVKIKSRQVKVKREVKNSCSKVGLDLHPTLIDVCIQTLVMNIVSIIPVFFKGSNRGFFFFGVQNIQQCAGC